MELLSGDGPQFNSLEIDYFPRSNVASSISSMRRRHWPVFLTSAGAILLQVTIVLSTGLFERRLQPVTVEIDNLVTTSNFTMEPDFIWTSA